MRKGNCRIMRMWFAVRILVAVLLVPMLFGGGKVTANAAEVVASDVIDGNLKYILYNNGTAFVSGLAETSSAEDNITIVIPATVSYEKEGSESVAYKVTTIKYSAFKSEEGITSLDLSNATNLESIQNNAFYNSSLQSVTSIPSTLTSVGYAAFKQCRSLTGALDLSNVETIGNDAFYYCDALETVTLNNELTSLQSSTFQMCSALTTMNIPTSIESIGESCFSGCSNWSVNADLSKYESLTSIGKNAFSMCTKFNGTLVLPSELESIAYGTFYKTGLTGDLVLPEKVESIGNVAFSGCTGLTRVSFPDSLKTIGDKAFSECTGITSMSLPDSIETIGEKAFYGCKEMTGNLTIPSNLKSMGDRAFLKCNKLTGFLVFPDSIESIGSNLFGGDISGIVLPAGKENAIANDAFLYSEAPVYVPEGEYEEHYDYMTGVVTYKEEEDGTLALTLLRNCAIEIYYDEDLPYYMYVLYELDVPVSIYGKTVSSLTVAISNNYAISNSDYTDMDAMTYFFTDDEEKAELENGTEIICNQHYYKGYKCANKDAHVKPCTICGEVSETVNHTFQEVTQPCECGYIPFTVVENNSNMVLELGYTESPTYSVEVNRTYDDATVVYQWYENDTAIAGATGASYTVPIGKAVGGYTYYCKVSCGDYSIKTDETSVVVYESETIGGIKLINPEYVTPVEGDYIKDESNSGIYKILTVTNTDNTSVATIAYVKPIFDTAKEVVIPDTITVGGITYKVTSIDPAAFKGNKKISKVIIGNNITAIPDNAFKGCTALTTVKMGTGVKTIGKNAFYGCKKLKNVTIGNNVTSIGDKAFYKCAALTKISLPSKVTKIGKSAFQGCTKLKTVTAKAKKLTKIGANAFYGCKKLTKLTLKSTKLTKKSIGKNAFKKTNKKLVIKVPKSKVKKYKTYFKNKGNKTIKVKK